MSMQYVAVQWTRSKKTYDALIAAAVAGYLIVFVAAGKLRFRGDLAVSDPILLMRAFGSCALILLHVVLCLGPLARLDHRFLPLLYNRRHLGVTTFFVGLLHGLLAIGFYHGFGVWNPLVSLLASNTNYGSLSAFPFQALGAVGLGILFLMAATSHDFWNRNLGPRTWKTLHMFVYLAYALLLAHVALGAMQARRSVVLPVLLCAGAAVVVALHLISGLRETARDARNSQQIADSDGCWIDAGLAVDIPNHRARIVSTIGGERIAVFRSAESISAITNTCAHQGGPLGEGKIIDGCVTCPWHGWQYRAHDGCAPPPFTEKIATHRVRVCAGRVLVESQPQSPGTTIDPVIIQGMDHD